MNATSLRADSKVTAEIVAIAESIIVKAKECAVIDGRGVVGDNSVFTFIAVIRNLRIDVYEGEVVKVLFNQPTVASGSWISLVDPFLLAEALREISVDFSIAVFDVNNGTQITILERA